jgi:hypothetical protein
MNAPYPVSSGMEQLAGAAVKQMLKAPAAMMYGNLRSSGSTVSIHIHHLCSRKNKILLFKRSI